MSQYKYAFTAIGDYDKNIEILNKTMWEVRDKLFDRLYQLQQSVSEIKRFDFICDETNTDLSIPERLQNELVFNIPVDIISNDNRKSFRRSESYKQKVYSNTLMLNTDLFTKSIIIFIDGYIYTNFYITADEDITKVSFDIFTNYVVTPSEVRPCLLKSEVDEMFANKSRITIFVIPAYSISTAEINRQSLINVTTSPNNLSLSSFTTENDVNSDGGFICSVCFNDNTMFKHKILHTNVDSSNNIQFLPNLFRTLTNTYSYLNLFHIPNYDELIELPDGKNYFKLSLKTTPIPNENIFIFRKDINGNVYFDHTTKLTNFYPNIYKIEKDHNDSLLILSCYAEPSDYEHEDMMNDLSLYHRFVVDDLVSKYEDDSIPEYIKNYTHIFEEYNIPDYLLSLKEGYEYKTEKLISLIEKHGDFYSTYLNNVIEYNDRYTISIPENLNDYRRLNNHREITNATERVTFSEECYLFKFEKSAYDSVIYIDNMYFPPIYDFYDNSYRYLYIPTRLINTKSVIVVEPLPDNYLSDIKFTSTSVDTYVEINLKNRNDISVSEVFISYNDNGVDKYLISSTDYEIYKYLNGSYTLISDDDFFPYPVYYVKVINSEYLNTELKFRIANESFIIHNTGSTEFVFNKKVKNDKSRFLFYKNGQLIPKEQAVKIVFSANVEGPHKVNILLKNNSSDIFTLVYTHTTHTLQYYLREINTSGVVDLYGIIDKPLDFKWFDIYLNGLKLNEDTSEFLGPYLLLVKNVNTIKNLEIYEKYFKNLNPHNYDDATSGYRTDDVTNYIYKNILGISDNMESILGPLEDTMDDILDDLIIDYLELIDTYMYPNLQLINPDLEQFTEEMTNRYPTITYNMTNFYINPDEGREMEMDIFFNHKITT